VTVVLPLLLVGLVLAHTFVRSVLYRPWKVKPVYRFLFVRSAWYRSWMMRRHVAAFRRMNGAVAGLVPVARRVSEVLREMAEVLDRAA
jgi:hypothetical protein